MVAGSGGPAASQTFGQFIGFGDSTNDSGWYRNAAPNSTNPVYNTDFAIAVTQGGGEATTNPGLVVSQYLAAKFGLTAIPADQPGGTNYSTGDARNAQFNTVASGGLLGAVPTVVQMQNYLAANTGLANGNALYLISSGGNDITYAANNIAGAVAQNAYVTTAANALLGGIVDLAAAGARYIIVPNTPSSFGTAPEPTLRATYNSVLWNGLAAAHVNFIPADVNAMYRAVTSNFSEFGLIAGAGPACTQPAGIPSGWAVMCSPTSTISTLVAPNAEFTHLFADDEHLSTAGQMILGDYEYSLVVAPIEISMLAEAPVKTRAAVIDSIFNQIAISERGRNAGTFNTWVSGDVSALSTNSGYPEFPNDPGVPLSGTVGADYALAGGWLVGGAMSVGTTQQSFSLGGNFKFNEFAASFYAANTTGPFWADLVGTIGGGHYDTDRIVPIGITSQANLGTTNGSNVSVATEAGYKFFTGPVTHGPLAGITMQRVNVDGFTETDSFAAVGGFTALSFADQIRDSAVTELGYKASLDLGIWQPFAKVVWDHELVSSDRSITASLTSTVGPSYTMPAVVSGHDWAMAQVGTTVAIGRGITGYAVFVGQIGETNVVNYSGQVGLNFALNPQTTPAKVN
ncbi:MAG: autotransporter domain-containing protein [Xanthobacteraceae bacterium]